MTLLNLFVFSSLTLKSNLLIDWLTILKMNSVKKDILQVTTITVGAVIERNSEVFITCFFVVICHNCELLNYAFLDGGDSTQKIIFEF